MNKTIVYPDWVEKYRSKGHTIKKTKYGYGLYKCTSTYVRGQKPKSVQTFLGVIDENKGFIPKTVTVNNPEYIEYGLSHFIINNFKRELQRTSRDGNIRVINLGIIMYIFGSVNELFIQSCALTHNETNDYIDYYSKISDLRIRNVSSKIDKLLHSNFDNEDDRNVVEQSLRLCVVERHNIKHNPNIPNEVIKTIENAGLKYE